MVARPPYPENPPAEYSPAADATCARCGAKEGRSGAHDRAGRWHSLFDLMTRFGFDFEKDAIYDRDFGAPTEPEPTVLAGGECQWCRKGGA